jgi:hypothetical protein
MQSIRGFSLFKVLVLALAAMGASAIPTYAQSATGKFTLAHKVRWASAVLPPGEYSFSLDSQNPPARIMVRQVSGSMVAILLPQGMSEDKLGGASSLVLHAVGGESVVSSLRLANLGVVLQFASPKLAMPVAETAGLGPIAQSQPAK